MTLATVFNADSSATYTSNFRKLVKVSK